MKKFSDYVSDEKQKNGGGSGGSRADGNSGATGGINGNAFEMLKNVAAKYEGASKSELISAILAEAARARRAGTLSDAEIDAFVASVSPMLGKAQKNSLDAIIAQIKNTK